MMTCKEVLDALSDYLDADMKEEVVTEMRRHIGVCSDCRAEFDTLSMTIKLYKHESATSMPDGCHDRLVKILEIEKLKLKPGSTKTES
ncbi:MAG: zf-HC2 domain-containing protein [Candidatus Latescibacteria bacterium]|nr:zf-HC2 domain-containing protein [Candidatus Latescibacterota bacterium]